MRVHESAMFVDMKKPLSCAGVDDIRLPRIDHNGIYTERQRGIEISGGIKPSLTLFQVALLLVLR